MRRPGGAARISGAALRACGEIPAPQPGDACVAPTLEILTLQQPCSGWHLPTGKHSAIITWRGPRHYCSYVRSRGCACHRRAGVEAGALRGYTASPPPEEVALMTEQTVPRPRRAPAANLPGIS